MVATEKRFIPGCFQNLGSNAGESLAGYLLRLAQANGYGGIRPLLRAANVNTSGNLSKTLFNLRQSADQLANIGAMATGDTSHLQHFLARPIGDEALFVSDCRVDNDTILGELCQICPDCLREDSYAREEWDFAVVTACPRHKARLHDKCHHCARPIGWSRTALMHCPECGSDFREAQRLEVTEDEAEVAHDFGALAPFRFGLFDEKQVIYPWDTAFRLFKILALPMKFWGSLQWPNQFLQSLDIESRHRITSLFAEIHHRGVYEVSRLNRVVDERLAPLRAIPKANLVESHAMSFLFSEAALPNELAECTCYAKPQAKIPRGAQLFSGRPPSFTDLRQVASFLSIDRETLAGLLATGMIDTPGGEHPGYDIDQILDAQRFLSNGLLSIGEVAVLVGVPLDWHEHGFDDLLPIWNKKHPTDVRVPVEHLVRVQLNLADKCRGSVQPEHPVTLRKLAERGHKPFQTVALGVNRILSGGINRLSWRQPFDWASLQIDESEAESLIGRFSGGLRP